MKRVHGSVAVGGSDNVVTGSYSAAIGTGAVARDDYQIVIALNYREVVNIHNRVLARATCAVIRSLARAYMRMAPRPGYATVAGGLHDVKNRLGGVLTRRARSAALREAAQMLDAVAAAYREQFLVDLDPDGRHSTAAIITEGVLTMAAQMVRDIDQEASTT